MWWSHEKTQGDGFRRSNCRSFIGKGGQFSFFFLKMSYIKKTVFFFLNEFDDIGMNGKNFSSIAPTRSRECVEALESRI